MSARNQLQAADVLSRAVHDGVIPGAVVKAELAGEEAHLWVCGKADTTVGSQRRVAQDTLFDLASLTKVVSTNTLVLALVGTGRLLLEQPVRDVLPEALPGTGSAITVADLLTHTSGLPATIDLEAQQAVGVSPTDAIMGSVPVRGPGELVVYSDIGFMLLGLVVERTLSASLSDAFTDLVATPLGMMSTRFGPVPALTAAATEPDAEGVPSRGTVHDENTRVMGGVAGHAGLFSNADDLGRFARWWLSSKDTVVPASLRREAERCQSGSAADGCRGLGWACRGDRFDFLEGWPATAISHSGFTGTSIALDPGTGSWVVALTNAVHYGRHKERIRSLRLDLHRTLSPHANARRA